MKISSRKIGNVVYFFPEGEIDECSAKQLRIVVDDIIDNNVMAEKVVFDLSAVTFMDSTGIGFLIGRYKKLNRMHIAMGIERPNLSADRVLSVSGIYNLIPKI